MAPVIQSPIEPTISPHIITTKNNATDSVMLLVLRECTSSPWQKLLPKPVAARVIAAQTEVVARFPSVGVSPLMVSNQMLANGVLTIVICIPKTIIAACQAKRLNAE